MKTAAAIAIAITLTVMSGWNVLALTSAIELKDGSVVVGEIKSFNNGAYKVESSLGALTIPEKNVTRITTGSASGKAGDQGGRTADSSGGGIGGAPGDLTNAIISDPAAIAKVMELGNDPDVKAILNDPAAMQAIQTGDVSALMSNPGFMKLLTKPQVQDISRRIQGGK
jgi:hypothetical protein